MTIEDLKKSGKAPKVRSFKISKPAQKVSAEDERNALQNLFDDMRSDRLQQERRMERSMAFARNYVCKD